MDSTKTTSLAAIAKGLRAISNEKRLQIMHWILDPTQHFDPQIDGDLVEDGVCVGRITEKIGLSQPTVTSHMKVLMDAKLVSAKKIKNWVFYKPRRDVLAGVMQSLQEQLT